MMLLRIAFALLALPLAACAKAAAPTPAPTPAPIAAPLAAEPAAPGPVMLTAPTSQTAASQTAASEAPDANLAAFERQLDAAFASGDFVGLSVAVVEGGKTRMMKSWGVVEDGGARIGPHTVFRIGSLSKGFAASLAGLAMNEGLLAADDPVTRFAPALKMAGGAEARLTLGEVLSHRTGLPPNAYDNLLEDGVAIADIYPKYKGVKLICPVGACYSYQNIAFDIAGLAVSSAYGTSYADAAEALLFAPLDLADASVGEAGLVRTGDYARPHVRERIKGTDDVYTPWRAVSVKPNYYRVPAAGGVNASISDMAKWLSAQMGHAPATLPGAVLDLIHAPQTPSPAETIRMRNVSPNFKNAQYAYGWRRYDYAGAPLIAHAGTVEGYAAQIAFLPDRDVGIVILSNARSKRLWRILPTFLDLELGLPHEDYLALDDAGEASAGAK